jgi:hypothetical protein
VAGCWVHDKEPFQSVIGVEPNPVSYVLFLKKNSVSLSLSIQVYRSTHIHIYVNYYIY